MNDQSRDLEACLSMFGWICGGESEQFLANGDRAEPEIVFHNSDFNSTVYALNPLVDRNRPAYAGWGLYEEGTFTDSGDDPEELLASLSSTQLNKETE